MKRQHDLHEILLPKINYYSQLEKGKDNKTSAVSFMNE